MIILKPSLPLSRPFSLRRSITFEASDVVRTKGIMISTFVKPITFLTFFIALHSSSKHSLKSVEMYLEAPLNPIIGFSSFGSYSSPANKFEYSLDLKSDMRMITGDSEKLAAIVEIPSVSF